ncbi:MAG: DUF1232 domain-containing protein [Bacteroidaceae bacterium]|nr:DUF1232 domain-containing protein [Bacteroidaceae bacterium]MBR6601608.1 DUF1232 domain-containing protein [Bacteroidaceae bacterium]
MEKENQTINVQEYEKQFSEEKFWDKVANVAKKAGIKTIYQALRLFYGMYSLPIEKKAVVVGALGYFILPADLIPDFIVALGYTDDTAVLAAAAAALKDVLSKESDVKAKDKLVEWFGEYDEKEINIS